MDMVDTVRTVAIGAGSTVVRNFDYLSDPLDVLVGVATFIFLLYKIKKEIYDAKDRKGRRDN